MIIYPLIPDHRLLLLMQVFLWMVQRGLNSCWFVFLYRHVPSRQLVGEFDLSNFHVNHCIQATTESVSSEFVDFHEGLTSRTPNLTYFRGMIPILWSSYMAYKWFIPLIFFNQMICSITNTNRKTGHTWHMLKTWKWTRYRNKEN